MGPDDLRWEHQLVPGQWWNLTFPSSPLPSPTPGT